MSSTVVIPCLTCCKGFTPRRRDQAYCSTYCVKWWPHRLTRRRSPESRPGDRTLPRSLVCRDCGCVFVGRRRRVVCDECLRQQSWSRRRGPSSRLHWRQCNFCGRWMTHGVHCDEHCRRGKQLRLSVGDTSRIWVRSCKRCGASFTAHTPESALCSSECLRRAGRSRRKAARRAPLVGPAFTTREIAERDGWRCHLCGRLVPDRQYTAADDDPTIDHLIPVSEGGEHSRTNVRLAHNRCNWERQSGGTVQLLLVG